MIEDDNKYIVIFKEIGHCDCSDYWEISEFDTIDDASNYINGTFVRDLHYDMKLMGFY